MDIKTLIKSKMLRKMNTWTTSMCLKSSLSSGKIPGIIAGSVIGGIALIVIIVTIVLHFRKEQQKRCVINIGLDIFIGFFSPLLIINGIILYIYSRKVAQLREAMKADSF